jgi:hypothetical protein
MNEHVTVHDIRGFIADDLAGALEEAYAVSRGTRCQQYLFSLSLNPPEDADVTVEEFESAIEDVERKLKLLGQPRIIVFHEKNGRRHCHAVWSRINDKTMTALNMAHYKLKLQAVARALFLKHGWPMPKGLKKGKDKARSPLNFARQEAQQAERLREDPKALKEMFQKCWAHSDSRESFAHALEEQGYYLARGDRRGFIVVDVQGKIYSLTRWLDLSPRDLKSRIGSADTLPSAEQAKIFLGTRMTENINKYLHQAKTAAAERRLPIVQELRVLTLAHREERSCLLDKQQNRWDTETKVRIRRFAVGMSGVWQQVTGKHQFIRKQNETEIRAGLIRDRKELHTLVQSQLAERRELQKTVRFYQQEYLKEMSDIKKTVAHYIATASEPLSSVSQTTAEKPIADRLVEFESRISAMTDDIATLQAALENALISDATRTKIRIIIEKTVAALQARFQPDPVQQKKTTEEQQQELEKKTKEYNKYIRLYAELQERQEQQRRQSAVNKEFYAVVNNMSYSLNGLPLYKIAMTVPPEMRLNEKTYVANLKTQSNIELQNIIFKPTVSVRSTSLSAVPELRKNVLQVKELLARANPSSRPNKIYVPLPINTKTPNIEERKQ